MYISESHVSLQDSYCLLTHRVCMMAFKAAPGGLSSFLVVLVVSQISTERLIPHFLPGSTQIVMNMRLSALVYPVLLSFAHPLLGSSCWQTIEPRPGRVALANQHQSSYTEKARLLALRQFCEFIKHQQYTTLVQKHSLFIYYTY